MKALKFSFLVVILCLLGPAAKAHPNHSHHHHHTAVPLHEIKVTGDSALDHKIRGFQARLAKDPTDAVLLENLGWLFVSKARAESEHSLYAHAIRCAKQLLKAPDSNAQGKLMLGHLYLQEHRFAEAKEMATALVQERGWHYDHGLLGDILLDTGDTSGALQSYEAMMKQRPGLESYARAGMVRWQRGQLPGAIEAMQLAISAGSLRNPEPLAWAQSKLGGYLLQNGNRRDSNNNDSN